MHLDEIAQRLQNASTFNIWSIDETGKTQPWFAVSQEQVVRDLLIHEPTLGTQVQAISSQVQYWGRLAAQAKRVWEIEERRYRIWRSRFYLNAIMPPPDDSSWKKPTEKTIEAKYRVDPEYSVWQERLERAEEAFNATQAILDGFRAKAQLLKTYAMRVRDDAAPRLAV